MTDIQKYQRRIDRERAARKEAERLLEEKSAALYDKNMELFSLSESLEKLVAERTAQMQKARDDALAALRIKSDFIANMSHELRTPMNGVLGVLELLQSETLNPEQSELLGVAQSSGKHLLEVINDILDFSKIEANKISIELAPLEIRPYIKEVMTPFALQAKQKGLLVSYQVAEDVEQALVTDKLRLTQIISNLLSNAIKFTHSGEVSLAFEKLSEEQYRLTVTDTRIGISAENINSVFTAFVQADSSITREFGGTGLGMNITKRLVDMLHGSIAIESELGIGTSFSLDIHMQVAQLEASDNSSLSRFGESEDAVKLLLVEDHQVNQMVAKRLLENWGFEVVLAENGAHAIEIAQQASFDGILMDLQMPVMGGVEAAKTLRKQGLISVSVPIIAMTAHSSDEHIKECLAAGMQAHVSKPLNKARLLAVLQDHIKNELLSAESTSGKANSEHFSMPHIHIRHLELADGLQRVGGDWNVMHGLLKRFLDEFRDFYAVFSQAKADNMNDYGISMLHKLKGSGGNLGFHSLNTLASRTEAMLIDQDAWPEDTEIAQLDKILSEAHADFEQIGATQEQNVSQQKPQKKAVTDEELLLQISQTQESLKQDVFAAQAALDELLTFDLSAELLGAMNQAHTALQNFDTDTVTKILAKARLMME